MKKTPAEPDVAEVPARVARREQRRERSRDEIVEAARRVLLRDGVAGTTLDAVAREVGLTKAALYYYFRSKDALLFEVVHGLLEAQHRAMGEAVAAADDGADALRGIVTATVRQFEGRLDDFRLAWLHGQVAAPGEVHVDAEQLARLRPINDVFGAAAERLADDRAHGARGADVDPRLLSFLASVAAVGLLTVKGAVEHIGDPLRYTDEELVEGLARVFEAAAGRRG